jgi:hypothetical protein
MIRLIVRRLSAKLAAIRLDWLRQGSLDRPSHFIKTTPERICFHVEQFGPLSQASTNAVEHNHAIPSHIPHLLCFCRPPDVAWLVSLLVVDAFHTVLRRRPTADVVEKSLEIISPLFCHLNPASTVVAERFALLVVTA